MLFHCQYFKYSLENCKMFVFLLEKALSDTHGWLTCNITFYWLDRGYPTIVKSWSQYKLKRCSSHFSKQKSKYVNSPIPNMKFGKFWKMHPNNPVTHVFDLLETQTKLNPSTSWWYQRQSNNCHSVPSEAFAAKAWPFHEWTRPSVPFAINL